VDVTALNLSAATSVVQVNDSGEPAVKRCQHWTYDHTQFTSTIVSRVRSFINYLRDCSCAPILQFFSAASDGATAERKIQNCMFSSLS